jgi:hypothetical protein
MSPRPSGVVTYLEGLERVAVFQVEVQHEGVDALVQDEVGAALGEHGHQAGLEVPQLHDGDALVVAVVIGPELRDQVGVHV